MRVPTAILRKLKRASFEQVFATVRTPKRRRPTEDDFDFRIPPVFLVRTFEGDKVDSRLRELEERFHPRENFQPYVGRHDRGGRMTGPRALSLLTKPWRSIWGSRGFVRMSLLW